MSPVSLEGEEKEAEDLVGILRLPWRGGNSQETQKVSLVSLEGMETEAGDPVDVPRLP